jgi:hypothetical protein
MRFASGDHVRLSLFPVYTLLCRIFPSFTLNDTRISKILSRNLNVQRLIVDFLVNPLPYSALIDGCEVSQISYIKSYFRKLCWSI